MPATVSCPTCGKHFRIREEILGRTMRCTGCKEPFTAEPEVELLAALPFPAASIKPDRAARLIEIDLR